MVWKGFVIQGSIEYFIDELISCLKTMFYCDLKRKDPSPRNKNPIINEGIFIFYCIISSYFLLKCFMPVQIRVIKTFQKHILYIHMI